MNTDNPKYKKNKQLPFTGREFLAWCKRQMYHFVFISSLLFLTALVTWWAIFLSRSIEDTYQLKIENAVQNAHTYAFFMRYSKAVQPGTGPFSHDEKLEIVKTADRPNRYAHELAPAWEGYWLQPADAWLAQLADKLRRRRAMVIGESAFLLLLILVSGFMIYRMYWLERRTTRELHELWSRVSHEIKTPITGVKAFLQTLRDQPLSREEVKPLLDLALKQVDRQQQLAENMLVGQKLKRRGEGMKMTSIGLHDFFKKYLQDHSLRLAGNTVTLTCKEELTVKCDPEALHIIMDNIADNAIKYAGEEPALSITITKKNKKASVVIEDNGPGIEPGMEENIFKAYKRLGGELPKGQRGTGMGLYISRRLARKMGGDLTAQAAETGTRFILSLDINKN